jgi:acetyl-CoA C-acetyltransferase
VIVSAVRTPIGTFRGGLASVSATKLGATVIKACLEKASRKEKHINR